MSIASCEKYGFMGSFRTGAAPPMEIANFFSGLTGFYAIRYNFIREYAEK